jgi:2'-5' RNA ligase
VNVDEIRSFIAVRLPGEVKAALASLQQRLKTAGGDQVKWVEPESIHITLKFLGNISPEKISQVLAVIETASAGVHPFKLEMAGPGAFPSTKSVRVVWVGLAGDLEIMGLLQKRIEDGLVPLGFPAEARPFTPHLTLARVRDFATPAERSKLGQVIENTRSGNKPGFNVNAVYLMKSQLTRQGAIYTEIGAINLK